MSELHFVSIQRLASDDYSVALRWATMQDGRMWTHEDISRHLSLEAALRFVDEANRAAPTCARLFGHNVEVTVHQVLVDDPDRWLEKLDELALKKRLRAKADAAAKLYHDWGPVPAGGPIEEGGVCRRCGKYANSQHQEPCVP